MEPFETPCSVIAVNFREDAAAKDNQDYFVVGTAYSYAGELLVGLVGLWLNSCVL